MNKRWLFICIVLLAASIIVAFYIGFNQGKTPVLTPAPTPAAEQQPSPQEVPKQEEQASEQAGKAVDPLPDPVRVPLRKRQMIEDSSTPPAGFSLKQKPTREILPGVKLEKKELSIQLEKENESLNIRRTENSQVQMLWKQKF